MPKWVTVNLGIKILSFFIALLIWFYVITERVYEEILTVPVICTHLREGLVFTKPLPASVKVKIKGKGKELIRLRFGESVKISLDFSEAKLGWSRIEFKKEDVSLPYWSKIEVIDEPTPNSFVVRIDKKVRKWVKIVPRLPKNLFGEQANLIPIYEAEIVPRMIEISGGSADIHPISILHTEEIVTHHEPPETLKVKIEVPDGAKASVDSVTVILKKKEL
ncbi:MAG: hypothetical protein QMD71_06025 [bacterium]|nr:hypothetical protein [bacterium]